MLKWRGAELQVAILNSQNDPRSNLAPTPLVNIAIGISTLCHLPSVNPLAYRSTGTVALSFLFRLQPSSTPTEAGSGASAGDFASTRIWNVRCVYGARSIPALAGYHPNRFQPIPRYPGPSPCILMLVLPLMPLPESVPTLLQPAFGSQASHPWAPLPAPSPSQITSRPPVATGPPGAAFELDVELEFRAAEGVGGAATTTPFGQGQRQPAVPSARTASHA